MLKKSFILVVTTFSTLLLLSSCSKDFNKSEVVFYVVGDTHFDPPPETDQYYHILAINSVCGTIKGKPVSTWQPEINGIKTNFVSVGKPIEKPEGVVLVGDITDRAEPSSLELFKTRYEKGAGDKVINFPVYVGLGNHDLDPQHVGDNADKYRNNMLEYVTQRHNGKDAPVPVVNFDLPSKNYSWDWGNIHFVQTHRYAGNTENNLPSSIHWLKKDLSVNAANNKPVVIFQHYGFDNWSLEWYKEEELKELYNVLSNYNVIGIFTGHNHFAEKLKWQGINVFQVNNAWKDKEGNGSFIICKITDSYMDVVTCRWKNGEGDVELIEPFAHINFLK